MIRVSLYECAKHSNHGSPCAPRCLSYPPIEAAMRTASNTAALSAAAGRKRRQIQW